MNELTPTVRILLTLTTLITDVIPVTIWAAIACDPKRRGRLAWWYPLTLTVISQLFPMLALAQVWSEQFITLATTDPGWLFVIPSVPWALGVTAGVMWAYLWPWRRPQTSKTSNAPSAATVVIEGEIVSAGGAR